MRRGVYSAIVVATGIALGAEESGDMELYRVPEGVETRWVSFENPTGAKGEGGKENAGAKGHAFDKLAAGQTRTLLEVNGAGVICRMWFTLRERDPRMLRSLRLDMYWDGAASPAVSVPFGDFFGAILGRSVPFENEFFTNPEGRSFNAYLPMPFQKHARILITNESNRDVEKLFYDINYVLLEKPDPSALYFHASWRRERWTAIGKDFEILPKVRGKGRFLGAHVGIITHPDNAGWWGEGEVKMYLDGDAEWPTIVGTGTEDYIGTGWGQGEFQRRYQGSLLSDGSKGQFAFYRYHVPDPVYFHRDLRVTIQQMGGASKQKILELIEQGVELRPVSVDGDNAGNFVKLLESPSPVDLKTHDSPLSAWVNVYRRDDWSAVAFFYLNSPENGLPPLAPVEQRIEGLDGPPAAEG